MCILLFVSVVPCFAVESPYEALLKKGFSADFLNSLPEPIILSLYNKIGDNVVGEFQTNTVYLTEHVNGVQTYGSISENTLKMESNMIPVTKNYSDTILYVIAMFNWEWEMGKPHLRKTDGITINWDANLFYLADETDFESHDTFKKAGGNWVVGNEYNRPSEGAQGGVGYYTTLYPKENYNVFYDYVGGYTMISLMTTSTLKMGTTYGTSMNVNYLHNTSIIPGGISFPVKGVSVGIESEHSSDKALSIASMRYSK